MDTVVPSATASKSQVAGITAPPLDNLTIFELDNCVEQLPVSTDIAHQLFAQFVVLEIDNPTGPGQVPVVVPRNLALPSSMPHLVSLDPSVSALDVQGGVALVPEWNASRLDAPFLRSIDIADANVVIAERQLVIKGKARSVELNPPAISSLLRGKPTVVSLGADRELVCLRPAQPNAQIPQSVEIADVAQFLSEPVVTLSDGSRAPAQLTAEAVRALQSDGRADVAVGGGTTTVVVNPLATPTSGRTSAPQALTLPPNLQVAVYIPWQQVWSLAGYSRGDLLNTLSLAPQEETTIEIFSWDRYKRTYEMSSSVEVQNSVDQSDTVRNTEDTIEELTKTSEFDRQADGHIGVTFAGVNIGVGGGVQLKDSVNSVAKRTTGHIAEGTRKASHQLKQSRQTKVSESWEVGKEQRVTRKVSNPNMCHTLNLYYFEIVGSYDVSTSIDVDHAALCILVPIPISIVPTFDRATIRIYATPLRKALMYRDLADGFEASQLLEAHEQACGFACESCSCSGNGSVSNGAWSWVNGVLGAVAKAAHETTIASPIPLCLDIYFNTPSGFPLAITSFRRWAYLTALEHADIALKSELLAIVSKAVDNNQQLGYEDADLFAYALDAVGGVATLSPTKLLADQLNYLWDSARQAFTAWCLANNVSVFVWYLLIAPMLNTLSVWSELDDAGVQATTSRFSGLYKATVAKGGDAAAALRDKAATDAVSAAYGVGDLAKASEREDALLAHLRSFANHYRYAIWQSLSTEDQAAAITAYLPPGLVEPRVVGLVGNKLALPLIADKPPLDAVLADVKDSLRTINGRQDRLSLVTPGVSIETRLGACDACEPFIHDTRAAEIRLRNAKASQEELEAARYQARLNATPAVLDDPDCCPDSSTIQVSLDKKGESDGNDNNHGSS